MRVHDRTGPVSAIHRQVQIQLRGRRKGSVDDVAVEVDDEVLTLSRSVAETVSVKADPSPPARTALPDQLVLGRERYGR
jgi:hypothetical protein